MSKPFQGITFCPTAISEDVSCGISKKIHRLGGTYSKDLTKLVNVLIVGNIQTPKYKFVVENRFDIIFVDSEIINTIYDLWLSGDDITMSDHVNYLKIKGIKERMLKVMYDRFHLPIFKSFFIFIGRIECRETNVKDIEHLININYPLKCISTHFIRDSVSSSNSTIFITDLDQGARFIAAKKDNIPIIHPKWVIDCTRRNAVLDLSEYLLENVKDQSWDEIGRNSCKCWEKIGQIINIKDEVINDDFQPKISSKFNSNGNKIWENFMSKEVKTVSELKVKPKLEKQEEDIKLFKNTIFYLYQFDKKHSNILKHVIMKNGGECYIFTEINFPEDNCIFLCHSTYPVENLPTSRTWVTEFYIERCLHYKKLLPFDEWSRPFFTYFQIDPSMGLNVHITGFQGVELLHITKILQYLLPIGIQFNEILNEDTNILIVNLSQLNSIPENHTLRKNKYADMFYPLIESNQIFRNAMKRKIQFVNEKHPIPLISPGFLIELCYRAWRMKKQNNEYDSIYLNDKNWCVSSPKGNEENFCIKILNEKKISPNPTSLSKDMVKNTLNILDFQSQRKPINKEIINKLRPELNIETINLFKSSTREFLEKNPRNKQKRSISENQISQTEPLTKIIRTGTINPLQRSNSWGKMMSDQVKMNEDTPEALVNFEESDSSSIYTQITYGSNKDLWPSKRLSRQTFKNIDI